MKLRLTRRAAAQFRETLGDLASQPRPDAASVSARASAVLALLLLFPLTGRWTARRGVRRITISPYPYNLDHRPDRDEVVILSLRHASRRPLP